MEIFHGFQLVTFLTIVSTLFVWAKSSYLWIVIYTITLILGLQAGVFSPISFVFLGAMIGLVWFYQSKGKFSTLAFLGLVIFGILLSLHALPGFHNHQYLEAYQLNTNSGYFSIWFNYDKSLFGLLILGLVFQKQLVRSKQDFFKLIKQLFPVLILGLPLVYFCSVLLGYVVIDITFPTVFFAWALKNLFFTILAEELLFRGLIQTELSRRFPTKIGDHISVIIAGVLFGTAHFSGGINYVFLATIAGCVYGYAYKITGRIEGAILAHFLLNVGHFIFFSYPYLSS